MLKAQAGDVRSLSFSPDGNMLVAYGYGPVKNWRIAGGKAISVPTPAEDCRPVLPHIESFNLDFGLEQPDGRGFVHSFRFWEPGEFATGICIVDHVGNLTAWGALPNHAMLCGVSPDGRLVISNDTRDPEYGIPQIHPSVTPGALKAGGVRESILPIRCWEAHWGDISGDTMSAGINRILGTILGTVTY
jgi:hypothetical protein